MRFGIVMSLAVGLLAGSAAWGQCVPAFVDRCTTVGDCSVRPRRLLATVDLIGTPPFTIRWQVGDGRGRWIDIRSEAPLLNAYGHLIGPFSGIDTSQITALVRGLGALDANFFRVTLTNACGSSSAFGAGTSLCIASFGSEWPYCNEITIDDLLAYLDAYVAGDISADIDDGTQTGNTDDGVTIDDLVFYLQHFEQGC